MTPATPPYAFFPDDFPIVLQRAGKKDAEPIPLIVVIENRGAEPQPLCYCYDRRTAKVICRALSEYYDRRDAPPMDG